MNRTPSSDWAIGKPVGIRPASPTQFEIQAQELGLTTAHDYLLSAVEGGRGLPTTTISPKPLRH